MAAVELRDINMKFGDVDVLHDIHLKIDDGAFVVLVGPSGCGKSTTLRIIAGLETAHSGDVYIGGKCVTPLPPKDRNIAMVFQNYALYPHMNVFDNMAFGLKLKKVDRTKIDTMVRETAQMLGIQEFLERKPKELSGGQRQRVALGRAVVRAPAVFLFDEPLSNLDAKLRVQMRSEIKKLHNALKTTMVYVTHDQVEAMTMGDVIVVLKDGRIMQSDKALELYKLPANQFVAGFIGSPAMNFFKVSVSKDGNMLTDGDVSIMLPKSQLESFVGREVIMGVRPEHLRLAAPSSRTAMKAAIDVVENLGNELNIYASTASSKFVAKAPASSDVKPNSPGFFEVDCDHLHFFEVEGGQRIN